MTTCSHCGFSVGPSESDLDETGRQTEPACGHAVPCHRANCEFAGCQGNRGALTSCLFGLWGGHFHHDSVFEFWDMSKGVLLEKLIPKA